jgi:TolA-binding protein
MRLITSGFLLLVLSSATTGQDDRALLEEELRDAVSRQHEELRSREDALTEQTEIANQLLQRQQQYIEQLEAQIRALQTSPDSND